MDPCFNVPDHNANSQRYDEVLQRYQAYRQDRVRNLMLGQGAQGSNRNEGMLLFVVSTPQGYPCERVG